MLELRRVKEKSALVKIYEYLLVSVLTERTRPWSFLCHFALCIYKLNERQIVLSADIRVILTERGRDVNDTRTVCERYIVIAGYVVALFIGLCEVEQRLVFLVFKVGACVLFYYLIFALNVCVNKSLCQDILFVAHLDFYICFIRVHTESHI